MDNLVDPHTLEGGLSQETLQTELFNKLSGYLLGVLYDEEKLIQEVNLVDGELQASFYFRGKDYHIYLNLSEFTKYSPAKSHVLARIALQDQLRIAEVLPPKGEINNPDSLGYSSTN